MCQTTEQTQVVELTPPGRGAVAVVMVAGPQALDAVARAFVPRTLRSLEDAAIGRIILGRWGETGEELICCRRSSDQVEIHCHGGTAAVRAVVDGLVKNGCREVSWHEWTGRSSPDQITADARIALARATTERTASILVDQWNGALATAVRRIMDAVSSTAWTRAAEWLDELLERREPGLHLTAPWRIVVFGAPNVGKSSLINALVGFERSIVSPAPGTTRDVVTITTALNGWPVQLFDTAGYRHTIDELESAGIQLTRASVAKAELIIVVHDATMIAMPDRAVLESIRMSPVQTLHVINKVDLIPADERPTLGGRVLDLPSGIRDPEFVSALTSEGIPGLISTIGRLLVPVPLPAGAAVPFTRRQLDSLAAARTAVERHHAAAANDRLQALLQADDTN